MRFLRPAPHWKRATLWAVDLELTGLNPRTDEIVSVGAVPIRGGTIRIGEAYATLVACRKPSAPDSLAVHQILPGELAAAPPLDTVARELAQRLEGSVLVAHHAPLELAFLRPAFRAAGRKPGLLAVVDTLILVKRLNRRRTGRGRPAPTDLDGAREAFGLPRHDSHDALADAIATAELLLLLAAKLGARRFSDLKR